MEQHERHWGINLTDIFFVFFLTYVKQTVDFLFLALY